MGCIHARCLARTLALTRRSPDRMLVRVSHCRAELAGAFDEEKCRSTRQDTHDWAEFRVVWRKDELQLFQDNVGDTSHNVRARAEEEIESGRAWPSRRRAEARIHDSPRWRVDRALAVLLRGHDLRNPQASHASWQPRHGGVRVQAPGALSRGRLALGALVRSRPARPARNTAER
jgi:hypothetical protein